LVGVAIASCAVQPEIPTSPTGPSEYALALAVTASPDLVPQDGRSDSVITVLARDASRRSVPNLLMRADIVVNGVNVDFGTLSSRTIATGQDGRARVVYLSPPPPPPTAGNDTIVTIVVTPIGTDYSNAVARSVEIRLTRPGVILPPNGTPIPSFFFSPSDPTEGEQVLFDATASSDDGEIVSYAWNLGDGSAGAGAHVAHQYRVAGTFNVTLTVTDDRGLSASTSPVPVTIGAAADPVASFAFSPADPKTGQEVFFNAAASSASAGRAIVSYAWDFGDGSTGTGSTARHVFNRAASYAVTLTVFDSAGRKGVASKMVQVQ
jgi:PKD repeat protein